MKFSLLNLTVRNFVITGKFYEANIIIAEDSETDKEILC